MKEIQLEEMWGKINKALTSENKTFLESKTAKILPNNPTSQGFSADQIRRSLYEGILVLFEWLKTTNNSNVDFNNKVMETLTAITENNEEDKQDLANLKQALIDGTFNVKYLTWAIMATNDENGNRIIDTYATIERLTQVLEALTQEISDRKAADDLEKNERKEETSAIINSVNQEISDRTNAVSVLNNLITSETENRASEDEKVLQYAQSVNEALGNAKTELQGKIDSEAQTRLANDNEIKASITSKEDSLKALINSVKNELNGYITTLNNRVNNLPTNYVFDTYESMKNDLLNASNTKYKVGDTLFIKEVNKPDYWISAILSTKGTYGYYELSEQESKVDLSNYVKISELSREAIEEKFLETVENGRTKSFAARSFAATSRNSGIDLNNYAEYGYDGVSFHKNGMEYPLGFPEKDGVFALTSDIPQALKNPFALTINGQVYDGSSAVSITTETITEHDFVRFWHAGIQIQNDGTNNILRFSAFDTELEEFSPHISCQYDGPQYYWVWKFPQISGTFAMESQIPTKLSQLTNDGNYQTSTSDLKDNTTTFTTASTRSNVASGEKLSVSFGKIAKYFNDLKAVAFSGSKADIDLGNVDNTSDADKPVSNATQQALNNKANSSDVYTKSETDGLLNNKANKSDVYTKSETDAGLNKPLYNLGAYDTISGNVITRQTGYVDLGTLSWKFETTNGLSVFVADLNTIVENDGYCAKYGYVKNYSDVINNSNKLYIGGNPRKTIYISDTTYTDADAFKTAMQGVMLQYKLATPYTEEIIEGQPLITLDQQGSQWLRDEWEKGLNLWDEQWEVGKLVNGVKTDSSTQIRSVNPIFVNENAQYFINKLNYSNMACYSADNQYLGNATYQLVQNQGYIVTTLENTAYVMFDMGVSYGATYKNDIAIFEGDHPYPYQPYNQNKHITNNEAVFLKTESDRSANLLETLNITTSINGVNVNINNDHIILNGTATEGGGRLNRLSEIITLEAGTYSFKGFGNIGSTPCLNKNDGTLFVYIGETFTITETTQVYLGINVTANATYNESYQVMLVKGSTPPTTYQPYEGKVVHEKELENYRKNIYTTSLDANTIYHSSNYYGYGITNTPSSYGNLLTFQYTNKNDIPNFAIQLFLDQSSNAGDPSIYVRGSTSDAYRTWKRLAFTSDLPTPGIFSLVGNNVDTLTISKNETYFIVSVAVNPIYVEGNTGISFIGSSLVTTVGMLSGEPKICLNGSAYTLDNNSVTLKTTGLMKVYKVNY